MDIKRLLYSTEDGICTVTINNPDALNALNSLIINELGFVFDKIAKDDSILVVIITGAGRSFVAGADISEMADMDQIEGELFGARGALLFRKIETLSKPVIAAINGFALGGGCELAMACDIRIASQKAKFGQPEVSLGITPGFSGTVRLPKLIGNSMAKEMIFTGKIIDANEALRVGLINSVVEPHDLMTKALEMAKMIASNAPVAVRYSKEAINYALENRTETAAEFETRLFAKCFSTEDQKEGMKAFLEKRKPRFKNR
ncbi:MAG: enoyl-CoA hydratase [Bacteroidetes bacterium HGW-Bacteroidetes-8]|jgi:enoyl-CoA hydratase|nr:MAG: enoyl-CoA hydratase [Bacteroidetes bacterium HGW-Bacteroidetes-8]